MDFKLGNMSFLYPILINFPKAKTITVMYIIKINLILNLITIHIVVFSNKKEDLNVVLSIIRNKEEHISLCYNINKIYLKIKKESTQF